MSIPLGAAEHSSEAIAELKLDRRPAVIDIGSNNVRLAVYQREGAHTLRTVSESRHSLELQRTVRVGNPLPEHAEFELTRLISDFGALARGAGATSIRAVATSALRQLSNPAELLGRVTNSSGVPVELIDGRYEATLAFRGAVSSLPVNSGFVFDLGGGSIELIEFQNRIEQRSWSLPFGALAVTDNYLLNDPPFRTEIRQLSERLTTALSKLWIPQLRGTDVLVGTGGTSRTLARADRRTKNYPLKRLHGYRLSSRALLGMANQLVRLGTAQRGQVPGVSSGRASSIAGGAVVIATLVKYLGAEETIISGHGLREGLVQRSTVGRLPDPKKLRADSIQALSSRYGIWDPDRHRATQKILALLREQLSDRVSPRNAEIVDYAAMLMNAGTSINFYKNAVNSSFLIESAQLDGFSHRDIAVLTSLLGHVDRGSVDVDIYRPLLESEDRPFLQRQLALLTTTREIQRRMPGGICPDDLKIRAASGVLEIHSDHLKHWDFQIAEKWMQREFGVTLATSSGARS